MFSTAHSRNLDLCNQDTNCDTSIIFIYLCCCQGDSVRVDCVYDSAGRTESTKVIIFFVHIDSYNLSPSSNSVHNFPRLIQTFFPCTYSILTFSCCLVKSYIMISLLNGAPTSHNLFKFWKAFHFILSSFRVIRNGLFSFLLS